MESDRPYQGNGNSNEEVQNQRFPLSDYGQIVESEYKESWKDIARELLDDIAYMIEKERELVRVEMREKLDQARKGFVTLAIGSVFLAMGLFLIIYTSVIVLTYFLAPWAAALVVSFVTMVIGYAFLASGKRKLEAKSLTPSKSIESLSNVSSKFKERYNDLRQ